MTEDLEVIYKGHATIIKNKEYLSPKAYIEPFVERLSKYTNNFICRVKPADQLTVDDEVELIYNKVLIMAIFNDEYNIKSTRHGKPYEYRRIVAMTYGLDCRVPYCKFYTGVVDENMNFYAFGSDCISMQKITPEDVLDYSPIEQIIEKGLSDNCQKMIDQFDSITFSKEGIYELLGNWVDFTLRKEYINDSGKVKLASNMAVTAYRELCINKDGDFYTDEPSISMHDLYNSWANQLVKDDKDITNRYEKTKLINQMLKL